MASVTRNGVTIDTAGWTNPTNIAASDNTVATTTSVIAGSGGELEATVTNWGFTLESGAVIVGIQFTVEGSVESNPTDMRTHEMWALKGGVESTSNLGTPGGSPWSQDYVDETRTYGGAAELWGETWLYSDINASNFGCRLTLKNQHATDRNFRIDHITCTITYTYNFTVTETATITEAITIARAPDPINVSETATITEILPDLQRTAVVDQTETAVISENLTFAFKWARLLKAVSTWINQNKN